MTCCDIKKLYTRLLQPSQPLNASVLLSWNKSWEWAQHFRRLRWHVPAVEGRRWGVMRGNVCPLVKDVQWQNSWHHSETLRGRGVHVQLDQKHQAEAQSQEMDWIVQHLEVTLYMSKRTNHATTPHERSLGREMFQGFVIGASKGGSYMSCDSTGTLSEDG